MHGMFFSEREAPCPRLMITIGVEKGRSVVTITDNGGGISDDIIDRIFEAYVTTKGPDRGTSVGVFISKAIIEKNMQSDHTRRRPTVPASRRLA